MYWVELWVLFICFLAWKPLECVMSIFFAFHHDCECFKNTHKKRADKWNRSLPYNWEILISAFTITSVVRKLQKNRIIGSILAKKGQGTCWDKKKWRNWSKVLLSSWVQEETGWCNTDGFISRFWLLSLRLERFPPAAKKGY